MKFSKEGVLITILAFILTVFSTFTEVETEHNISEILRLEIRLDMLKREVDHIYQYLNYRR